MDPFFAAVVAPLVVVLWVSAALLLVLGWEIIRSVWTGRPYP